MAWEIQDLSFNWLGYDGFGGLAAVFGGSKHMVDGQKGVYSSLLIQGQTFAGELME